MSKHGKATGKRAQKRAAVHWTVAFLFVILLIWSNSLVPGDYSTAESDLFSSALTQLSPVFMRINPNTLTTIVRKGAHIMEYAVLSMCGLMATRAWIAYGKKLSEKYLPVLSGVAVAACDELIQSFVEGRAGMIQDVGIDTLGVLLGGALVTLITKLRSN